MLSMLSQKFYLEWLIVFEYSFRFFDHARDSYVKIPFLGAVSYLTLGVTPFCIAFAVVWAAYRRVSIAWIGQDILVRIFVYAFCSLIVYYYLILSEHGFPPTLCFLVEFGLMWTLKSQKVILKEVEVKCSMWLLRDGLKCYKYLMFLHDH